VKGNMGPMGPPGVPGPKGGEVMFTLFKEYQIHTSKVGQSRYPISPSIKILFVI
jgi:hypothetical protein